MRAVPPRGLAQPRAARQAAARALAQAAGYGVGFVLAHQFVGQLPTEIRQAVLGTVASKIAFQCAAEDARTFAREFGPPVEPEDLQGLPAFTAYAALSTGTVVLPAVSLTTLPRPAASSDGAEIREESRRRYGAPIAEVEKAISFRRETPPHRASGTWLAQTRMSPVGYPFGAGRVARSRPCDGRVGAVGDTDDGTLALLVGLRFAPRRCAARRRCR